MSPSLCCRHRHRRRFCGAYALHMPSMKSTLRAPSLRSRVTIIINRLSHMVRATPPPFFLCSRKYMYAKTFAFNPVRHSRMIDVLPPQKPSNDLLRAMIDMFFILPFVCVSAECRHSRKHSLLWHTIIIITETSKQQSKQPKHIKRENLHSPYQRVYSSKTCCCCCCCYC